MNTGFQPYLYILNQVLISDLDSLPSAQLPPAETDWVSNAITRLISEIAFYYTRIFLNL